MATPVTVNFSAANAPIIKQKTMKFNSTATIFEIQRFLKDKLKQESVVIIIDKCFVPTLDQDLGTLMRCFGTGPNKVLNITYGPQAVFG